jgi:hypothetical protein
VEFQTFERHPESVEFINGYPSPCRHIGRWVYGPRVEGEDPWTKAVIRYDPVEIENRDPLWMK